MLIRQHEQVEKIIQQVVKTGKTTHIFWLVCIVFCLLFFAWTCFGKLDIVSMANGRVVPSSKVKRIQHLEGGIVSEILAQEGDIVRAGQELIILEAITSGASVEELDIRIASLQADIIRLQGLIDGREQLDFPADFAGEHPDLVNQNTELFILQKQKYTSELAGQQELINQRSQDIVTIQARIRNNSHSLELLDKQVAISEELLRDDLTTEYKHLNFLREQTDLRSKIEEDRNSLKRTEAGVDEAGKKLQNITHSFRQGVSEELKIARRDLEEFTQRLKKFSDSYQRSTIRSPVDGIIKTLYVATIGGVVSPGQTVVDIVPTGDSLLVEAQLPIQDIGYVQIGQEAIIKLASSDASRFGSLPGEVVLISPDAQTMSDGRTFYTVRIKTGRGYFERGSFKYQLIPGMQVLAFIRTGQRTVLEYILSPFLYSIEQAMQER